MLSAMQTPSYKSSLSPLDDIRTEEQITDEILSVTKQIKEVLNGVIDICDQEPEFIETSSLFATINRASGRLPALYDLLGELEDELLEAVLYQPDPDEEYDNQEAYA